MGSQTLPQMEMRNNLGNTRLRRVDLLAGPSLTVTWIHTKPRFARAFISTGTPVRRHSIPRRVTHHHPQHHHHQQQERGIIITAIAITITIIIIIVITLSPLILGELRPHAFRRRLGVTIQHSGALFVDVGVYSEGRL